MNLSPSFSNSSWIAALISAAPAAEIDHAERYADAAYRIDDRFLAARAAARPS